MHLVRSVRIAESCLAFRDYFHMRQSLMIYDIKFRLCGVNVALYLVRS